MLKRSREDSLSSDPDSPLPLDSSIHSATPDRESSAPAERSWKYTHLEKSLQVASATVMKCHLPPHAPLSFSTYEAYNVHYQQHHVNRCLACFRNFPSGHYLELHIAENHDPLSDARRDRGEKTYGCFVETCDKLCSTPYTRRLHVTAKHQFPKDYDFFIVNDGLDKRKSMLRPKPGQHHRRRSSAAVAASQSSNSKVNAAVNAKPPAKLPASNEKKDVNKEDDDDDDDDDEDDDESEDNEESEEDEDDDDEDSSDDDDDDEINKDNNKNHPTRKIHQPPPKATAEKSIEDITKSMSALKFVPRSVKFGRGGARGGFARR